MQKLSFDLDEELFNELNTEAEENERSVSAQLRVILKERYK